MPPVVEEAALKMALASRPDYMALEQQVKAAEFRVKAARAERYPTVGLAGDYGVLGTRPNNAFPTWTATAALNVPIFEGGRIEASIHMAEADLAQRKAQREDLKGRIEQDVASAMLDLNSAAEQVEVARVALEYAQQALEQSQDRFSAGVTNNIEVVQAQESLATANQMYIGSLYAHNIAKVLLARSVGQAEQTLRQVLGSEEGAAAQAPVKP
jgi:outer membrane protein TolC